MTMVRPRNYGIIESGGFKVIIALAPQQHWDDEYCGDDIKVSRGNIGLVLTDDEFHRWFREGKE